jgi:predicted Holliday junction resolvase-like endonuclease
MNIESFAIGMLTMVVFAVAILVVLGVLKVFSLTKQVVTLKRRLEEDERELSREINMVEQTIMNQVRHESDHIHREIDECHRHADEVLRNATSYTDSRFDKATGRTGAKEIIKG